MYESYLKLKPNDLHDHLTHKLKLHPQRIAEIKSEVAEIKESKRTGRITDTVLRREWGNLLYPLRVERDNAKVGLRYKSGKMATGEQRIEVFTAYIAVMDKLLDRLSVPSTRPTQTPRGYAKTLNAQKRGSPITNEGQHWTDWVPPHIKHAISEAFAGLLRKHSARPKVPFQRVVPPSQHIKQKETLLKRTLSDLAIIERMWNINPTEENADLYIRINQALRAIDNAGPTDLMPATWRGMELPQKEHS